MSAFGCRQMDIPISSGDRSSKVISPVEHNNNLRPIMQRLSLERNPKWEIPNHPLLSRRTLHTDPRRLPSDNLPVSPITEAVHDTQSVLIFEDARTKDAGEADCHCLFFQHVHPHYCVQPTLFFLENVFLLLA